MHHTGLLRTKMRVRRQYRVGFVRHHYNPMKNYRSLFNSMSSFSRKKCTVLNTRVFKALRGTCRASRMVTILKARWCSCPVPLSRIMCAPALLRLSPAVDRKPPQLEPAPQVLRALSHTAASGRYMRRPGFESRYSPLLCAQRPPEQG